jgi:hypothetical protein
MHPASSSTPEEGRGSVVPTRDPALPQGSLRVARAAEGVALEIFRNASLSLGAQGAESFRKVAHTMNDHHIQNVISYALAHHDIDVNRLTNYALKLGSQTLTCTLRSDPPGGDDVERSIDINELLNQDPPPTGEALRRWQEFSADFAALKSEATKVKGYEGRIDFGHVYSSQRSKLGSSAMSSGKSIEIMNSFSLDKLTLGNSQALRSKIIGSLAQPADRTPPVTAGRLHLDNGFTDSKNKREQISSRLQNLLDRKKSFFAGLPKNTEPERREVARQQTLLDELIKLNNYFKLSPQEGANVDLKIAIAKAARQVAGDVSIPIAEKKELVKGLALSFLTSKVERTWTDFFLRRPGANPDEEKWLNPDSNLRVQLQRKEELKASKELAAEAVSLLFNDETDYSVGKRVTERYAEFCSQLSLTPQDRDVADLLYKHRRLAGEALKTPILIELGLTQLNSLDAADAAYIGQLNDCFS